MASLAERDTIMISGFILISISLSDEPESFISALQDILGKLRSTIKKPVTWEGRSEDSAKRGSKIPVVAASILQLA